MKTTKRLIAFFMAAMMIFSALKKADSVFHGGYDDLLGAAGDECFG